MNFAHSSQSFHQILLWTILNFWTKFVQGGYLWSKTEEVNIIIEFRIFKLFLVPNLSINWQFWFFSIRFAQKKFFWFKTEKSGHHHWILYSQVSAKYQLKLTILSFWTKFTQKGYFQLKTEQAVQVLRAFAFCVVKVNSIVVSEHFEDLKNPIILNISKKKLVVSCLLDSFYIIIV